MSDGETLQQDRELRRQLVRRAVERVWSVDAGELQPASGPMLENRRDKAAPAGPAAAGQFSPDAPEGSVAGLARRYRARELSPVDVVRRALARAEESQPLLNAFITLLPDSALEAARASEQRFARGEPLGPLDGVPVAVKDLIHMRGVRTTAGSRIMAGFVAAEDAPVIARLRQAGAVLLGKSNLHEFAYGGTGDVSHFGPCRNPRNPEHVPGGSSSGSGVVVAAGICPVALGTDTAGSIRIPAALCGVVGLKPTYGRVPTEGVIPLSWSQDHVGPLTGTVEDAGLALAAMSDFSMPELPAAPVGLKIGVCRELFFEHLDAGVRRVVERAVAALGDVREVAIPHLALAGAGQVVITAAEAAAFHRRWLDSRPDDYAWSVRHRLEAAREVSGQDYVQALRLRRLLMTEMASALAGVDVLAMPTEPVPAPKLGQREALLEDGAADVLAILIRNTGPINYTGFPAISLPCGTVDGGLPVGLQLVALPWQEGALLQAARTAELRLAGAGA